MQRLFSVVATMLFISQTLLAQNWERRPEQPRPEFLIYEGINRAGEDSMKSCVDVPYRIDHAYFVPVKNDDRSVPWPFVRRGEVAIDLIDSLGMSRARAINEVLIGQNSSERTPEAKQWHQGISTFLVAPGNYTIQIEVTDLESKRNFLEKNRKVRARTYGSSGLGLSTPVFVAGEPGTRFPDTLTLQNLGGNTLFAASGSVFFEVNPGSLPDTSLRVSWTINQIDRDGDESQPLLQDTAARFVTLSHIRPDTLRSEQGVHYRVASEPSSRVTGVLVTLPVQTLLLRMFSLDLDVAIGPWKERTTIPFRTLWPTMPFSLKDVDLALDALRLIVTPDQLDSLQHGSYDERREHLETFWRLRDRTPGTADNELMSEYYRRVDYAMRNFGTMRIPDGSRTDRGKIFILYGPPTSSDRILDPVAGYQETWIYQKLGKKFVFRDASKSGNYELSSTTGL